MLFKTIELQHVKRKRRSSSKIPPSSCQNLAEMGHYLDGLYAIKERGTKKVQAVYCQFEPSSGNKLITQIYIISITFVVFSKPDYSLLLFFSTPNNLHQFFVHYLVSIRRVGLYFSIKKKIFQHSRRGKLFLIKKYFYVNIWLTFIIM